MPKVLVYLVRVATSLSSLTPHRIFDRSEIQFYFYLLSKLEPKDEVKIF